MGLFSSGGPRALDACVCVYARDCAGVVGVVLLYRVFRERTCAVPHHAAVFDDVFGVWFESGACGEVLFAVDRERAVAVPIDDGVGDVVRFREARYFQGAGRGLGDWRLQAEAGVAFDGAAVVLDHAARNSLHEPHLESKGRWRPQLQTAVVVGDYGHGAPADIGLASDKFTSHLRAAVDKSEFPRNQCLPMVLAIKAWRSSATLATSRCLADRLGFEP